MFNETHYNKFKKYKLGSNARGIEHSYLLPPATHLSRVQKNVLFQCIKICNNLPDSLKVLPLFKFKSN